jgi:hypothetical protein
MNLEWRLARILSAVARLRRSHEPPFIYFQVAVLPPTIAALCVNVSPVIDHEDVSVVVKNRASPPQPWRWEIYRAGRTSAIEHSEVF